MNGSKRVRQFHRWVSIVFTVTVVVCFAALPRLEADSWVFYLPLPPLALLLFTGLYLFSLPYTAKWRARRRAAGAE